MGKQHIIEDTIQILESVVERARIIQHDPDRELCLDIDLMLEDLRLLYRNYEALKKHCDAGHVRTEKDREVSKHYDAVKPSDTEHHTTGVDKSEDTMPDEGQHIPSFFADAELEEHEKTITDSHTPPSSEVPETTPSKPIQTVQAPTDMPKPEPKRTEQQHAAGSPASPPADSSNNQSAGSPANQHATSPENQSAGSAERQFASSPGQSERNSPDEAKGGNGKTVIDLFSQHQPRSIGDQFGQDDNSLHQRISSQKEDKSIGARLQQHPLNNIKDAIGLNEKFLFINELFEGDIQVYNEAIAKLNNMGTIKEAFDYLNELTNIHHWDTKRSTETIDKLAGFVQRRYLDR